MDYIPCTQPDCANLTMSLGLCRPHYLQQYHNLDLSPVKQTPVVPCVACAAKPALTRGYCRPCYRTVYVASRPVCDFDDCDAPKHGKMYCRQHTKQMTEVGTATTLRPWKDRGGSGLFVQGDGSPCPVKNCGLPVLVFGLCKAHTSRAVRFSMSFETARDWFSRTQCEVCGIESPLSVDHDHACCNKQSSSCGRCIRGMLCLSCNTTLGRMQDDPARLRALASYLEASRA